MSDLPQITSRHCTWKGRQFRSALELRWAVYFDALGTPWGHEPLFFRSKDGRNYLPDFRLPDLGVLVEVKPHIQTGDDARRYLAAAETAVRDELCKVFVFVVGPPKPDVHHAAYWKHGERTYSFASVFDQQLDAYACRRAQEYRAEDAEVGREHRERVEDEKAASEVKHEEFKGQFARLLTLTPAEIAAEYEARS